MKSTEEMLRDTLTNCKANEDQVAQICDPLVLKAVAATFGHVLMSYRMSLIWIAECGDEDPYDIASDCLARNAPYVEST